MSIDRKALVEGFSKGWPPPTRPLSHRPPSGSTPTSSRGTTSTRGRPRRCWTRPGGFRAATGEGDLFLEQGSQNEANPGFLPVLLFYTGGSGASAPYQTLFAPGKKFDELIEPSLSAADPDVVSAPSPTRCTRPSTCRRASSLAGIFRTYGMRSQVQGCVPHGAALHLRWDDVWVAASSAGPDRRRCGLRPSAARAAGADPARHLDGPRRAPTCRGRRSSCSSPGWPSS